MHPKTKKVALSKISDSRVNLNTAWDHVKDDCFGNGTHFLLETITLLQEAVCLLRNNVIKPPE